MKPLIILVRKRLWSHGYRVRTAMAGEGFDLVVEGSYRVRVIEGRLPKNLELKKGEAVALVVDNMFGGSTIGFVGELGIMSVLPADVFGISASKSSIKKNTHDKEKSKKGSLKKKESTSKKEGEG